MIQFTAAQLNGWIAMYWWPLVRVLAFIAIAPPFANTEIPTSIKVAFGVVITVALAPMLPVPAGVSVGSYEGLWITLVQVVIGLALGFCVQLVFSAISGAGEVMSVQMGLGFASLLDPTQTESSMLLGRFLGLTAITAFIAGDGHLVLLHALFDSFTALPVSAAPLANPGWQTLAGGGTIVFALAVRIALPIIAIMMIVNLGFAVLSRTAQALNPFAVGIAATLVVGLMLVMVMMTSLAPVVERSVMDALELGGRALGQFGQFGALPR
ncbi:flagellar biosynthetic protein FliR [Ralstonia sp. SET104]|uniref:flagellar biosynthetic protein FliR n=1 Tax=Ralstonia sp. SET104 TaxID=2448774 RepID=UPI000F58477A|nr:flagellar biosynthetic protein FliR [Ralstonia sp. SET104]GCB05834.1 flagellar biosynthetic protein FliR [Ralstonia sp. SET104]